MRCDIQFQCTISGYLWSASSIRVEIIWISGKALFIWQLDKNTHNASWRHSHNSLGMTLALARSSNMKQLTQSCSCFAIGTPISSKLCGPLGGFTVAGLFAWLAPLSCGVSTRAGFKSALVLVLVLSPPILSLLIPFRGSCN